MLIGVIERFHVLRGSAHAFWLPADATGIFRRRLCAVVDTSVSLEQWPCDEFSPDRRIQIWDLPTYRSWRIADDLGL